VKDGESAAERLDRIEQKCDDDFAILREEIKSLKVLPGKTNKKAG
jgi:hypothetical protein